MAINPLSANGFASLFGFSLTEEEIRAVDKGVELRLEKTPEEDRFRELIMSTNREGAEKLLFFLRHNDFFWVPASVTHSDNEPHGLLKHSLKVYDEAMKLREEYLRAHPEEEKNLSADRVLVSALLHDVCKCDAYSVDGNGKPRKKDELFLVGGHGSKSLIMVLLTGFHLNSDEMLAIRWHMGSRRIKDEDLKIVCEKAKKDCPLVNIIIQADYKVTH